MIKDKIPQDPKWAIIAIAISWFFWGPIDGYYALYLKSFNLDYSQIGWILSLSKIMALFLAIPAGILADKFSARKMMFYILTVYFFLPLGYYYAGLNNIVTLVVGVTIGVGILKILRNVAMDTYIKEKTPRDLTGKVWAFHDGFIPFMWAMGVFSGSLLIHYLEIYELFLLVPIGILIKLFIFYRLSEPEKREEDVDEKKDKKDERLLNRIKIGWNNLLRLDKQVIWLLGLTFLYGVFTGNLDAFLGLFAEDAGYGLESVGFLIGFVNLSFILAVPFTKITNKVGKYSSMAIGQLFMTFCMFIVFLYGNMFFLVVLIGFFVHWTAFQLVRPTRNALVIANTPYKMQGEITGIQFLILNIANMLGAILFGYISEIFGINYVFLLTCLAYFVMAIILWYLSNIYDEHNDYFDIHPHGSLLSRFHINFLSHSLTHDSKYNFTKKILNFKKRL